MRVRDLVPGDRWRAGDTEAIFITQGPHPVYRGLMLVVWWIVRDAAPFVVNVHDGEKFVPTSRVLFSPRYSFDALRADQELIGAMVRHPLGVDHEARAANIREALKLP